MSINKDQYFEISGRKIGYHYDPLVIAEIGINHCGKLDLAFELVDAALSAGVEVVKHQTHIVSDEMTKDEFKNSSLRLSETSLKIFCAIFTSPKEAIHIKGVNP